MTNIFSQARQLFEGLKFTLSTRRQQIREAEFQIQQQQARLGEFEQQIKDIEFARQQPRRLGISAAQQEAFNIQVAQKQAARQELLDAIQRRQQTLTQIQQVDIPRAYTRVREGEIQIAKQEKKFFQNIGIVAVKDESGKVVATFSQFTGKGFLLGERGQPIGSAAAEAYGVPIIELDEPKPSTKRVQSFKGDVLKTSQFQQLGYSQASQKPDAFRQITQQESLQQYLKGKGFELKDKPKPKPFAVVPAGEFGLVDNIQKRSFFGALGTSGKRLLQTGTIGTQGFSIYKQRVFEPFAQTDVIATPNINPQWRGTEIKDPAYIPIGYQSTAGLSETQLRIQTEIESGVPVGFIGKPREVVVQTLQSKYQKKIDTGEIVVKESDLGRVQSQFESEALDVLSKQERAAKKQQRIREYKDIKTPIETIATTGVVAAGFAVPSTSVALSGAFIGASSKDFGKAILGKQFKASERFSSAGKGALSLGIGALGISQVLGASGYIPRSITRQQIIDLQAKPFRITKGTFRKTVSNEGIGSESLFIASRSAGEAEQTIIAESILKPSRLATTGQVSKIKTYDFGTGKPLIFRDSDIALGTITKYEEPIFAEVVLTRKGKTVSLTATEGEFYASVFKGGKLSTDKNILTITKEKSIGFAKEVPRRVKTDYGLVTDLTKPKDLFVVGQSVQGTKIVGKLRKAPTLDISSAGKVYIGKGRLGSQTITAPKSDVFDIGGVVSKQAQTAENIVTKSISESPTASIIPKEGKFTGLGLYERTQTGTYQIPKANFAQQEILSRQGQISMPSQTQMLERNVISDQLPKTFETLGFDLGVAQSTRNAFKFGGALITLPDVKTKQTSFIGLTPAQTEIPRLTERLKLTGGGLTRGTTSQPLVPSTPKIQPKYPKLPPVPFLPRTPSSDSLRRTKNLTGAIGRFKQTPSFSAFAFDIKGKAKPRGLSGLGFSPISKGFSFEFSKGFDNILGKRKRKRK
jgi:hypothetical protein